MIIFKQREINAVNGRLKQFLAVGNVVAFESFFPFLILKWLLQHRRSGFKIGLDEENYSWAKNWLYLLGSPILAA